MDTELLKSKILDLLIKGDLTATWREEHQDIESADVLLEKIRSEKEKKLNNDLIAKGKKPTARVEIKEVAEKDKSFEIPKSWKWCRFGDVFQHNTGKTQNSSVVTRNGTIKKFITTSNLYWNKFDFTKVKEMSFSESELERCTVTKGDLLICEGGDYGRSAIWKYDYDVCFQNHIHRARAILKESVEIIFYYYVMFLYKYTGRIDGHGVGIQSLSTNNLDKLLIPIPPLEEQKELARIAEKLLTMTDDVASSYSNLEDLSKKAKAKVLDLLIKGDLTATWREEHQDIESADVLLEKIRSEKEKKLNNDLIAKGKKPTARVEIKEVAEKDKSFEIPKSWKWCRLGDISNYGETQNIPVEEIPDNSWVLELEDLESYSARLLCKKKRSERTIKGVRHKFYKGQVLYSRLRPYLNKVLVAPDDGYCTTEIIPISLFGKIDNFFICTCMRSAYFLNYTATCGDGVRMPRLKTVQGTNAILPLPPLEEQKELARIADVLLNQIDSLTHIAKRTGDAEDE